MGSLLFRDFYAEFSRLGDIASLPETQLQGDIHNRVSNKMRAVLSGYAMNFETPLQEVRKFCIQWDDSLQAARQLKEIQKTQRLPAKEPVKKSYGKTYEIPAKRVETSIFVKPREEGLIIYFHCGEPGYKKPDCPEAKKAGAYIRILEDGQDSNSDKVYSTADSGKE